MGLFSMESLALKWNFFFIGGATIILPEYTNLYMQQLGLSLSQISWTSLMGIQHLVLPVFAFLGDRFRARKLILWVLQLVIFITVTAPLLPLAVSLPTCFIKRQAESSVYRTSHLSTEYFHRNLAIHRNISTNGSSNSFLLPRNEQSYQSRFFPKFAVDKMEVKHNNYVPWFSTLFVFMVITRVLYTVAESALLPLESLATITYLKERRSSTGSYLMWGHIGGSVFLFAVGLLASHFTVSICGVIGDGYYITFIWASLAILLSSFAVPWFKYEYKERRVINWTEVKCVVCDGHYVFMLLMAWFLGSCTSFQMYWEFWYISELSGSPTIMGVGGLIRRPLVGVCFYLSGHLIEKVGDLKTTAVGLFLFSVSFLAISFINIPWLVLTVDLLQAAGYGFSYVGLTIHFSKAGSKASSSVILGLFTMLNAIGLDAGSGVMGLLFHAIGSKTTLLYYSITSAIILVAFLGYIYCAKGLDDYEKLPEDSDGEDEKD